MCPPNLGIHLQSSRIPSRTFHSIPWQCKTLALRVLSTPRSGSCCCAIRVNVGEAGSTAEMEGGITVTVCFIGGRGLTFQAVRRKGFRHLDLTKIDYTYFTLLPVPSGFWTIPYSSLVVDNLPNLCFPGFFPRRSGPCLRYMIRDLQPTMASPKQTRNTRFSFCAYLY